MIRPPSVIEPSAGSERIALIDALRGFALAGVLLMNLGEFTLVNYLDHDARSGLATASFDIWVDRALQVLVQGKAFTVFTLLFGIGFALQMERVEMRGAEGFRLYIRRAVILLGIGIAHHYLLWRGDILHVYAILALLLIPFRRVPDRILLLVGLVVALLLPPLLTPWMDALQASLPSDDRMRTQTLAAFSSPSYLQAMRHNAAYAEWSWLAGWGLFPYVLGRFLLGFWAGRRHLLKDAERHRLMFQRMIGAGLAIGLPATLWVVTWHPAPDLPSSWLEKNLIEGTVLLAGGVGSLALGIAYIGGFARLFLIPAWRKRLRILVPVGRMALTNYLLQSVLCVPMFYGFGLGIGPRFGYAGLLLAWALLFTGQVLASRWWLQRHNFGPVEWLWRSWTYGCWQPLRKTGSSPGMAS